MAFFYLCPHCGKHFESSGVCPVCQVALISHQAGSSFPAPKYCTQCGAPISMEGQAFCTSCGAPLSVPIPPGTPLQPPAPAMPPYYAPGVHTKPSGRKKIPAWGIAAIILGAVLVLVFGTLITLYSARILTNRNSSPGNWYQNNSGYGGNSSSSHSGNPDGTTDAKAIIVHIQYGTGAELDCSPSTADFVEVGLNIINTRDSEISLYPSNFYLTNDETGEKIYPYTEVEKEDPIAISGNKTVSGTLTFRIDSEASYHFNFVETNGDLLNSYELSR